ncbi:MAG: NnrS family protein [Gammaproteobacteria bacterium]|nr:NnrS family protein [Gammaproteobacteria bacterium]
MTAIKNSSGAPVWQSGFRPFYLLAVIYGPLLMLYTLAVYSELLPAPSTLPIFLWHGHEMIFGFTAAIAAGFILTALPGWAGTEEVSGVRLMLLTLVWLVGRFAFWFVPPNANLVAASIDSMFFILLAFILTPGLLAANSKLYLLLLPILAGFIVANIVFYFGVSSGQIDLAWQGVTLSVYSLMVLFVVIGGFLTPIFTDNYLRTTGHGGGFKFQPALEIISIVTVLLFALTGLVDVDPGLGFAAALLALLAQLYRMYSWRGWLAFRDPLVLLMQLGYCWLLLTFLVRALGEFNSTWATGVATHVFTIGAFGMMKLSLMTRVVLKHTGRSLAPPKLITIAFWIMPIAAVTRLLAGLAIAETALMLLSGLLWSLCWILYMVCFGSMLISPSLSRS